MAAIGWTGFMLFLLLNISMGKETKQSTVSCDVGQNVTLPCKDTLSNCSMVTWLFLSNTSPVIELVEQGKVKDTQSPERLTLGSGCSLRIKNLNTEDAGRYFCRLYRDCKNFTDISDVSLSVGENRLADRSCFFPPLSPFTVSPTGSTMSSVELSVRLLVFFIILILPPIIGVIYTKSRNHTIRDQVSSATELQEYVNA